MLTKDFQPPRSFLWIWNSRCCNKLRVFSWLLLMDKLNTGNLLKRKKFKIEGNNYRCVLCASHREETTIHLFFTCPFATSCWQEIGIQWQYGIPFFQMLEIAKHNFNGSFFMEIFIIAAWQILKQRNGLIFETVQSASTGGKITLWMNTSIKLTGWSPLKYISLLESTLLCSFLEHRLLSCSLSASFYSTSKCL